ncbi:MAG: histidine phosphatase family protein [Pseudomonadota bacterium]
MATELWLVRHGQADFGSDDYDRLTDLGWQQARWLGDHLRAMGVAFDAVAAGTLRRQQETAFAVAEALEMPVETVEGLEEYDADALLSVSGGLAMSQATSRADHFRRLRKVLADWAAGELHGVPESWEAFQTRLGTATAVLTEGRSRVLAASSGGAIAAIVARALDLPAAQMIELNLQARNTGVTRLIFARRGVYLNQFNGVPHLDRPDRRHAETYS